MNESFKVMREDLNKNVVVLSILITVLCSIMVLPADTAKEIALVGLGGIIGALKLDN